MNQLKPNIQCSQCGAEFLCGAQAGDKTCWCSAFPNVMPVPKKNEQAGCLCFTCLQEAIEAQKNKNP